MAENLLKRETLNYKDIEQLIGPPPFGKKRLIDPSDFEHTLRKEGEPPGNKDAPVVNDNKSDTDSNKSND